MAESSILVEERGNDEGVSTVEIELESVNERQETHDQENGERQ